MMGEELQMSIQQPSNSDPVMEPLSADPVPKRSKKGIWIMAGIYLVCVCICSVLCLILVSTGVGSVMKEKAPIEKVLDTFMKDMEGKDVVSAYALLSPRSRSKTPRSDLEKMLVGRNFILFDEYESITVENINISSNISSIPNSLQGTFAKISATVVYTDGFSGQMEAVMEKVDGSWKIYGFDIHLPPEKINPNGNNTNLFILTWKRSPLLQTH